MPLHRFIQFLTEPCLHAFARLVPHKQIGGGIDDSIAIRSPDGRLCRVNRLRRERR